MCREPRALRVVRPQVSAWSGQGGSRASGIGRPGSWNFERACILGLLLLGSSTSCGRLGSLAGAPPVHPTVPAAQLDAHRALVGGNSQFALSREDEYVVRIVAPRTTCSGTLIAEDQVLTAHHCVSLRDGKGRALPADLDPDQLLVELGGDYLPWGEVGVREVVSPGCGYAAGAGDLAILVLERRLTGTATLQPSLDYEPRFGEPVHSIGFGRCALSGDGIYRKHRAGGQIDRVFQTGFRLDAAICPGDSGGPVLTADTGEFVGVVSAGAMDGDEATRERVEFSRLDPFRGLFANAARIAAGTPASELPPIDCPRKPEEVGGTIVR